MRIDIDFSQSLEKNADRFFELSKKAKRKLAGLRVAMREMEQRIEAEKKQQAEKASEQTVLLKRKKDWFEKFRWFFTSDELLVIGGRDAKTNDWIVKKFLEDSDLYFHADIVGAPHCVLKTKKNAAPEKSKQEALAFAVVFSRAWQSKSLLADAYWVLPSQVSKKAPTGEAIGKGAFMIYGNRNYGKKIALECAIGLEKVADGLRVVSGPVSAVEKHAFVWVRLVPGDTEKGPLSKKLLKWFSFKSRQTLDKSLLDEIIAALPTGGSKMLEA